MGFPDFVRRLIVPIEGGGDALAKVADGYAIGFGRWDATTSPRPTASVGSRGVPFFVPGGTGVADALDIHIKQAADTYASRYPLWSTVGNLTIAGQKRQVLASSGNTTMTSLMSGSVMLMDGATVAYTLPAIGAGDIGMWFDFVWTVASTGATITAGAADILMGGVRIEDFDTANTGAWFFADNTDDLITTFNGGTKGGKIGGWIQYVAVSATRWMVTGVLAGDGAIATPFS